MSSVKLAATALLAMAFLTQVSGVAFAEDSNSDSDSNSQFISPTRPASPAPYERKVHTTRPKHHEGDEFQVAVPPMVITPDLDDQAASLGTGTGAGATKTVPDTAGKEQVIEPNSAAFDPTANEPIQMQNVHPTSKTPADVFIESAQIGVGAMAAGAVVLAVTAAMRGVRFRRQARTDFIYEVESQE
jgi:hypothetical protein